MFLLRINFMLKLLQTLLFMSYKIIILIRDVNIYLFYSVLHKCKTNNYTIQRNLHCPSLRYSSEFLT